MRLPVTLITSSRVKASIERAIELLMEGKAIYLDLYDKEFPENYMRDVYVLVRMCFGLHVYVLCHIWYVTHNIFIFTTQAPEKLKYEICQGAARKLIGKYERFKGHSKTLVKNRHLVGLFTARVFDLQAPQAIEWGRKESRIGK